MRTILVAAAGAAIVTVFTTLALATSSARVAAQSGSSDCPSGFTAVTTPANDPQDVNMDGIVCEQRDVRSDTLVYSVRVDNSGSPCPAEPPGSFLEPNSPFVPVANAPGQPPDRNCNGVACLKLFVAGKNLQTVLIDDKAPRVCP
jgi:hypothetical protein